MIVFIELVKRVSILHEKFFIYKKQFTIHTHQINNTSEYFQIQTHQTTKQTIFHNIS